MTYVEFFDRVALENVCASLACAPERVIYIGDNAEVMEAEIEHYKTVFCARGQNIEFLYRTVARSKPQKVADLLCEIIDTYDDCVFDITGGEEIFTLVLGMIYAKHPERNLQIQRRNLRNGAVYDCDQDGNTVCQVHPKLTVWENIRIYGGAVVYGGVDEEKTYRWEMDDEFCEDLDRIWEVCKDNARFWNAQIGIFEAANAVGSVSEDGLITVAAKEAIEEYLEPRKTRYRRTDGIVDGLLKSGLLTHFDDADGMVAVSYKNKQVKRCLTKAGQALEMKVYATARELTDTSGTPIYNDVQNGVLIDWDGKWHGDAEDAYDTVNEIDVLLMHGVIPVFISCKNGVVTSDELYKLKSVAERFGGPYAKKVLVVSTLDFLGEAGEYLRHRAEDMGIRLIEIVQALEENTFLSTMRNLWCN